AVTVAGTLPAASAPPVDSHCGTEPGGNRASFVDHAQLTRTLEQIERTSGGEVDVDVAGYSNEGREIYQARVGHGDTVILDQCKLHDSDNHGTGAQITMLREFGGNTAEAQTIRDNVTIVAIPRLNVDGGERDTRQNHQSWDEVVAQFPQLAGVEPAW